MAPGLVPGAPPVRAAGTLHVRSAVASCPSCRSVARLSSLRPVCLSETFPDRVASMSFAVHGGRCAFGYFFFG
eukprot:8768084-Lingulodinium_polyedra.AAC.1